MSQYPQNFGQQPNNPYGGSPQQPQYAGGPQGGGPYGGGGGQYGGPPAKKGPNVMMILGIIAGVGGLLSVCCCMACGGIFYFGMDVTSQAVARTVESNPLIQQHIGNIEEISFNFVETGEAAESDPENLAFDISGPNGSGLLIVKTNGDPENMEIFSGELTLPSGETLDLGY